MKKLSIIIPSYNHADTIAICLDSILNQSRKADEIIVVDDGSTDNTQKALDTYRRHIKSIVQHNQGAPVARNNGFAASSGELVMFCDSDVRMKPNMLERLEQALEQHNDASFAYGSFRWGLKGFRAMPFSREELEKKNYIHTTALIRREHFPGFDPELKRFQDWDLWLTMSEQGHNGVFVDEELFTIVLNDGGRMGISKWIPKFLYSLPWKIPAVKKYEQAREIIYKKHNIQYDLSGDGELQNG